MHAVCVTKRRSWKPLCNQKANDVITVAEMWWTQLTRALQSTAINWSEGRRGGGDPLCKPKIRGICCTELSLKDSDEQVESLRVKTRGQAVALRVRNLAENKAPCVPAGPQRSEGLGGVKLTFRLQPIQHCESGCVL